MSVTTEFLKYFEGMQIYVYMKDQDNIPKHVRGITEEWMKAKNEEGYGIFFTVNELDQSLDPERQRTGKMWVRSRAIWLDDDVPRDNGPRRDFPLEPSLVVESSKSEKGSKYHYYWLTSTDDKESWQAVMNGLVSKYEGDGNAKDVTRYLRLPGFNHLKDQNNPHFVNFTGSGKYYPWETVVDKFPKLSQNEGSGAGLASALKSGVMDNKEMIKVMMTAGQGVHDAMVKYSYGMIKDGVKASVVTSQLKGFLEFVDRSERDDRWNSRYGDCEKVVSGAVKRVRAERLKDAGVKPVWDRSDTEGRRHTELTMPPGLAGLMAEDVLRFMRQPCSEIAIVTALHAGAVFAGGIYSYKGLGLTYKRILLAVQSRGKDTPNKYVSRLAQNLDIMLSSENERMKFIGSGDYTSMRGLHLELQEFPSRSLIVSEAGQAGKSKAGDKESLRAYILQLLSTNVGEGMRPKRYTQNKDSEEMKTLYNLNPIILHESVPDRYIEVMKQDDNFADGDMSRADIIWANEEFDPDKINFEAGIADIDEDVQLAVSRLARRYLSAHIKADKPYDKRIEIQEEPSVTPLLRSYQIEVERQKNQCVDNPFEMALLARKSQKMLVMCSTLAVMDSISGHEGMWRDNIPVIKREHFDWVVHYQQAVEDTLRWQSDRGAFSNPLDPALDALADTCHSILVGKRGDMPRKMKERSHIPHAVLMRALANRKAFNDFTQIVYRGDKSRSVQALVKAAIDMDILGWVDKDVYPGKAKVYEFMFMVEHDRK